MKKIIYLFIVVFAIFTFFVSDCLAEMVCDAVGKNKSNGNNHWAYGSLDCNDEYRYLGIGAEICITYSEGTTQCYCYSYNYDTCTDFFEWTSGTMYDCGSVPVLWSRNVGYSIVWKTCGTQYL